MNKAKLYMFVCISILVFSVSSTLALYIWRSTTSAIVNLEVCAPIITFVGGSTINSEDLIPVLSKENGLKKEISVKLNKLCQDDDSAIMNMYMTLDLLPKELQEDTFIYELYQDNELIISDNFKGKSEGETIRFAENEVITEKELTYTLYIYIDGKRDNPITMSNRPFRFSLYGEGTDAIYEENYIRAVGDSSATSLFLNTDIMREEIESIKTVENNIVPDNIDKSFDISSKGDKSVMLWYDDANSNSLYEVYMGSSSGLIKLNTNSSYLFANLTNASEIDLSKLDTSKVINMFRMFINSQSLINLDLSSFDTSNVNNMAQIFEECKKLVKLNLNSFNTENLTSTAYMFHNCPSLASLNLNNFNTSKVTNMNYMFAGCRSLTSLDLSNFDTKEVTKMGYMFSGCSSLTSLDLSNFNTKNVTSIYSMFNACSSLTNLDLSRFNTEKITSTAYMFHDCSSLASLNLSNFNTSKVTDMRFMFAGSSKLKDLDLSSFDTKEVTNMEYMFRQCSNLKIIDFRNADFSNVTGYVGMFADVTSSHIYVKDTIQREWLSSRFSNLKNITVSL